MPLTPYSCDQNQSPATPHPPTLTIDWAAYMPFFADADIPETQKRELIETLWSICMLWVDFGLDLDPGAQICGESPGDLAEASLDMVSSFHQQWAPPQPKEEAR